jgi:hypothetical protein
MRTLLLIGCFNAVLSGCCLLECVGQIDQTSAPYGAHFYKEGMTRESRLDDLVACGSGRNIHIYFSPAKINRVIQMPEMQMRMEAASGKFPLATKKDAQEREAEQFLVEQLDACMEAKNYIFIARGKALFGCDARCMYP